VTSHQKIWWVQCEALLGLFQMYKIHGNPVNLERLNTTLQWIQDLQHDATYSEMYEGIIDANDSSVPALRNQSIVSDYTLDVYNKKWLVFSSVLAADAKGHPWKSSYHTVRALTFLEEWMKAAIV